MRSQLEAARPHPPLPIPQTSFIGCESAIADIRQLLRATRLLTLTGSGGSGKTRLALRVAEEALADYPDGVYWVDLAALADPALAPQAVAAALGLREQSSHSVTELLIEHLRECGPLLILDNCEHLRAACADLLTTLFSAGVLARVLATSRAPLAVEGEQVYPAPMLAVPGAQPASPAELAQVEAVRLWVERARMVSPAFTLHDQNAEIVAEICRRLEGMPLAIELAAARVNVLSPKQILDRLGDSVRLLTRGAQAGAPRHRTLRAALDWSFDLLSPAEQAFFTRLAVFAGSFSLEAVESVCAGDGLAQDDLLDLLADLVEKSLVIAAEAGAEMRYRLLAPIRHYAAARLRVTDQEAHWRGQHAAWCLALARRADLELSGPDQALWLERLAREHDNLRAALAWYTAAPDRTEAGLQLGSALTRFWCIRGYLSEGRRWLETLLGRLEHQLETGVTTQTEVDAFNALGRIAFQQSNFLAARAHHERSLTLARQIEYDDGVETALIGVGAAFWELGDYQAARSYLEETVRYARPAQHLHALGQALNMLGLVCMHQGDRQAAQACLDESLGINRRLGNRAGIATVLWNLALLAGQGGDLTRASLLYQEALRIHRELGNRGNTADI
ncbi:MAG TPA: tetratricopeptide repeat protein, partial [Caldilineaceae bacterium]|nr:tetratricopeptide repeat protein [Caldilineaceae bacterium]